MRLSRGDIVAVRFMDHAEGREAIDFTVFGRIAKSCRSAITIECWTYTDKRFPIKNNDYNVHCYTIVKSAVISIRKLVYVDSGKCR